MKPLAWTLLVASGGLVLWTWIGYPLALVVARATTRPRRIDDLALAPWPSVSLIVPVHNGAEVVDAKLANLARLDYDPASLEIIVVSDGSTDGTVEAIERFNSSVRLIRLDERCGKSGALNVAAGLASCDVLVINDVDAVSDEDYIRRLVRPFRDPSVGVVGGAISWVDPETGTAMGEGLYWKFEQWLWSLEADLGLLACAPGTSMAVRRHAFMPIPSGLADDVIVPFGALERGLRVTYVPDAVVRVNGISSARQEFRNRARMTFRSLKATTSRRSLLNPLRHPLLCWSIGSHKLSRWVAPYFMLFTLGLTVFLYSTSGFARVLLWLESAFYGLAVLGAFLAWQRKRWLPASAALSFVIANAAAMVGVAMVVLGRKDITSWPSHDPVQDRPSTSA